MPSPLSQRKYLIFDTNGCDYKKSEIPATRIELLAMAAQRKSETRANAPVPMEGTVAMAE
jgi:hypothetical protein